MPRGRTITIEQEDKVIDLYQKNVAIKEIMRITGIKSEQTIYRLLDENEIPRRPKVRCVKVLVSLEEDVAQILEKQTNISYYINESVRHFNANKMQTKSHSNIKH